MFKKYKHDIRWPWTTHVCLRQRDSFVQPRYTVWYFVLYCLISYPIDYIKFIWRISDDWTARNVIVNFFRICYQLNWNKWHQDLFRGLCLAILSILTAYRKKKEKRTRKNELCLPNELRHFVLFLGIEVMVGRMMSFLQLGCTTIIISVRKKLENVIDHKMKITCLSFWKE